MPSVRHSAPIRRAGLVASLLLASLGVAAESHTFGVYRINVDADVSEVISATEYQVTVENEELLLTRLTAPYDGKLSRSFVADLDRDGGFEVVVTFTHSDGERTEAHLYSWNEYLLEPQQLASLDAGDVEGYRGGDEFAVTDGQLVRVYQIYELAQGEWQPTARQRRLRYSFEQARWVPE
ncbi:MAG: hypothetical protein ACU85V_16560 [Gammaproteobacteria bacterium]